MPLFDEIVRTETRGRGQNEGAFNYLNTSDRPGVCAIRELLESWFEHLPEAARADIRGRFRDNDDVQHQSAFFELFWHELLLRSGYEVEVHPPVHDIATNPDFLAKRGGVLRFYLEATLAMPPIDAAADRRFAALHDTLDRMNSPDYFLEIEYRGSPQGNVRGRALRERLELWLRQLDYDDISRLYREQNYEAVPQFTWPEEGMTLMLTPIPKGPETRGQPGVRPVGIVMPAIGRMVRTHDDIKVAIEGKANKYGDLGLPLVVVVNVMDDLCEDIDVMNALFGEEQIVVIRQPNGQLREHQGTRAPNGALWGRAGARNRLVSAVVVTHKLSPSTLRTHPVELIHNPWAAHSLRADALPLAQREISLPKGHVHRNAGTAAADILGIPAQWPVRPAE